MANVSLGCLCLWGGPCCSPARRHQSWPFQAALGSIGNQILTQTPWDHLTLKGRGPCCPPCPIRGMLFQAPTGPSELPGPDEHSTAHSTHTGLRHTPARPGVPGSSAVVNTQGPSNCAPSPGQITIH